MKIVLIVCSIQEPNTFSMATKHCGFLIQTMDDKDFYDWLYAVNPLLAGQMRLTVYSVLTDMLTRFYYKF